MNNSLFFLAFSIKYLGYSRPFLCNSALMVIVPFLYDKAEIFANVDVHQSTPLQ
jgi:hypothetical protein